LPEFGGEELFQSEPARVFAVLTDLDALAATIPDVVSAERVGSDTLRCVVRPGFSFLRGTLRVEIRLQEVVAPVSAKMHVTAQGIGVSLEVESRFEITPHESGSRLNWQARILAMKGLLASVSPGLVSAAADQVIRSGWQELRGRLGEA
jgi:carbon monoxide dehydrogenase subunit G